MLRYLATAAERVTEREVRAAVEGALPEGDAIMSTLAQHWIELGTQRGL
jgi:hypothetical protein